MSSTQYSTEKSEEFYFAVKRGDIVAMKELASDPQVDVNWNKGDGMTSFVFACHFMRMEAIKFLLTLDRMDPNIPDDRGNCAFKIACWHSSRELISIMLADPRIDINRLDDHNLSPLCRSLVHESLSTAELILASGRSVETKSVHSHFTPENIRRFFSWNNGTPERLTALVDRAVSFVTYYERNPVKVVRELRNKLGLRGNRFPLLDQETGKLFALMILFTDEYLQPERGHRYNASLRFFSIAYRLPMELQMVLCHLTFGSMGTVIKTEHSEPAFKEYAKE